MDFSGNHSGNFTPSWHPEPTTRGSFTILSSCIITLTLCVWKAVHLNLPEHASCLPRRSKTDFRYWLTRWITHHQWRKVGWMIVALLAPEMLAFTAWAQRRQAQQYRDVISEILGDGPPRTDNDVEMADHNREAATSFPRHSHNTLTHGFYAIMGGYAIDTSALPEHQKFLPGHRDRLTITPNGIRVLAKRMPNVIPRISIEEIRDKSKADTFAKTIVTVQASFFVIQCIYRLVQLLPISLLELNTFAHTLCALTSYGFWWEKPLDVAEPTVISAMQYRALWAVLCFESDLNGRRSKDSDILTPVYGYIKVRFEPDRPETEEYLTRQLTNIGNREHIYPEDSIGELRYVLTKSRACTSRDVFRWLLVSSCIRNRRVRQLAGRPRGILESRPEEYCPDNTLSDRSGDWPQGFDLGDIFRPFKVKSQRQPLVAFSLAGLSYGSLHLLAWDFPFASRAERLLWKVAGITIASSGPAIVFLNRLAYLMHISINDDPPDALLTLYLSLVVAYVLLYMFSRVYLIVESFISFAYLPDGAFKQPQWTYYFPHIS